MPGVNGIYEYIVPGPSSLCDTLDFAVALCCTGRTSIHVCMYYTVRYCTVYIILYGIQGAAADLGGLLLSNMLLTECLLACVYYMILQYAVSCCCLSVCAVLTTDARSGGPLLLTRCRHHESRQRQPDTHA
jgi:hypothetical protein